MITPYKQQVGQLKSRFQRRFGNNIIDVIDFNTVDGFQGQEKEIIIFSCVRAGQGNVQVLLYQLDTNNFFLFEQVVVLVSWLIFDV